MKVTQFTNKNVGTIEDQIVAACEAAGITGVSFSGITRSYGKTETTFKIKAQIEGTTSHADMEMDYACKRHAIDPTVKGAKGQTLVEYHPRKHKYPFIYTTVRGARYKTDAAGWKRLLA